MSDPNAAPDALVENYASEFLKANHHWAKRMNQVFPQYFPSPGTQAPKILWIGCSDSRVQESDAIMTLPGNAFVHRNIANQVHIHDDSVQSVLTFSLEELGVRHVAIVGHEHCGGVVHALKSIEVHHPTPSVIDRWLVPLVARLRELWGRGELPDDVNSDEAVKYAVRENVKLQVRNLERPPLDHCAEQIARKKIWVHGWVYNFSTGFIEDLKITKEINW